MSRHIFAMLVTLGLATSAAAQAPQPRSSRAMTLTPQDYIDIQQLSARYAFAIDTCTNGGQDFADLFTEEGEFSVSQQWGVAGNRKTQGRVALVKAAGGDGQGGCVDPKTQMGYGISHLIVNLVITPTADGAIGKVVPAGHRGRRRSDQDRATGRYDDVYVKTQSGWRIKSRIHVFPNLAESVQFGSRGRRGTAGTAPPQPAR